MKGQTFKNEQFNKRNERLWIWNLICPKNRRKAKLRFMCAVQQHLMNIYDEHQLQIKHFFLRLRTLKRQVNVVPDSPNG
jgi:hypothetical protein